MRNLLLVVIMFFCISCETHEKRFFRLANDRNIYISMHPTIFHLDFDCRNLKKAKSYTIVAKDLKIKDAHFEFCTKCCLKDDIEKLRSQIKEN